LTVDTAKLDHLNQLVNTCPNNFAKIWHTLLPQTTQQQLNSPNNSFFYTQALWWVSMRETGVSGGENRGFLMIFIGNGGQLHYFCLILSFLGPLWSTI